MGTDFLKLQLEAVNNEIKSLIDNPVLKKELYIIHDFLLSLLKSDNFTFIQKEDLRKLSKELEFDKKTKFDKWLKERKSI